MADRLYKMADLRLCAYYSVSVFFQLRLWGDRWLRCHREARPWLMRGIKASPAYTCPPEPPPRREDPLRASLCPHITYCCNANLNQIHSHVFFTLISTRARPMDWDYFPSVGILLVLDHLAIIIFPLKLWSRHHQIWTTKEGGEGGKKEKEQTLPDFSGMF